MILGTYRPKHRADIYTRPVVWLTGYPTSTPRDYRPKHRADTVQES